MGAQHQRSVLWVLVFVAVVWFLISVTAPSGSADGSPPPAKVSVPRTQVTCPPSAPNAAAGCLAVALP